MEYIIHLGILIAIFAILGVSLNLVVGYTGLLSVAEAAFFGIGAYATAIVLTTTKIGFFSAGLIGMVLAMVAALLIGLVLSRFKDDYYALASLGFGVIVFSFFLNWQSLTGGPLGIAGIGRPELFGFVLANNFIFLVFALLTLALVYGLSEYITTSSFGLVLKAIREDEEAIQVFGYHTDRYKLTIFVISAGLAAVAGALYASYISFIGPSSFSLIESIFILSIVILGGLANHKGAILGAALLIILPELLRFVGLPTDIAAQSRQLIYGVLLVVLMLYRPRGLIGDYKL